MNIRDILRGKSKSCGCLRREVTKATKTKHGDARGKRTAEYRAWGKFIDRCTNPKHPRFKDYGGRGIKVCDEWLESFVAFLTHVGRRPSPHHSIDRIDNDGHYEPGNVRWATRSQQAKNTRRNRGWFPKTAPAELQSGR